MARTLRVGDTVQVITGKERGIVAAASYEAKARGEWMPIHQVRKVCSDAVILPSDYETYSFFPCGTLFCYMRFCSSEHRFAGIIMHGLDKMSEGFVRFVHGLSMGLIWARKKPYITKGSW